ncbi:Gfo/Idh/MocA family protein [Butyrivibrio sp. AC2005]|uniref:Gfo/Idh/MocA family protein n=1 Tax=Butyrivibrio sp. AC2005 TaxID=1280672 RepID=UPI000417D728|nr:Gfo/Idh/MocA family oxidoreductase [Butyrivibrio sp. AC2005]
MGSTQKFKKVKTAVIGCGMISDIYIRNLKELFDIIDLVAIANRSMNAAKEKAETFGIDRVMTIDEVATSEDIELVVNLTPANVHYEIIKKMLEAGKHVYTEKMFTTRLEEAEELIKIAEEKKLQIAVAPDTVLGAGIQTARNYLDSGIIGEVTSGFVSVNRDQCLMSELFRFLQQEGGAIPYDAGIYYIGALITLLGSVKRISGFGAPALLHNKQLLFVKGNPDSWQLPGTNVLCGSLEFENGALVSLHFNGNNVGGERTRFELFGTRGNMELGDPNKFDGPVTISLPENEPVKMPFTHGFNGKNMLGEPRPFDGYGHRGVGVADLAYAIRQGRKNRLSKEYGYHCMEILLGLDESIKTGKVYELKSRAEVEPLKPGFYSSMFDGMLRADAELSLIYPRN